MSRNQNRIGDNKTPPSADGPINNNFLNFVTPTEFVELPSAGIGYADTHPLHQQDTVEIRFMTAKDEDILSSQTLLKKGIAIDRFVDNILVNKTINSSNLLIGDKNAILIAARVSGYGSDYKATVNCGQCGTGTKLDFDLTKTNLITPEVHPDLNVIKNSDGTYNIILPLSKFNVGLKLLTGADETFLAQLMTSQRKNKLSENLLTDQFKRFITSVEGHTSQSIINEFVDNMPAADSRHIRLVSKLITPDVKIKENLSCDNCGHEQEVDVPFGTDFFWPDS